MLLATIARHHLAWRMSITLHQLVMAVLVVQAAAAAAVHHQPILQVVSVLVTPITSARRVLASGTSATIIALVVVDRMHIFEHCYHFLLR